MADHGKGSTRRRRGGDQRRAFIERWFQKARKAKDPFDRFYCLWIPLVAASKVYGSRAGVTFREIYADREMVLEYFLARTQHVHRILEKHERRMLQLAQRRGVRYGKPILDTRSWRLRIKFSDFADHYLRRMPLPDEALVEAFGEVVNKIRLELFQGIGCSDGDDDRALLELVNPVLMDILEHCEQL